MEVVEIAYGLIAACVWPKVASYLTGQWDDDRPKDSQPTMSDVSFGFWAGLVASIFWILWVPVLGVKKKMTKDWRKEQDKRTKQKELETLEREEFG